MIKQEILALLKQTEPETIFAFVAEYAADDKRFYEKIKAALLPCDDIEKDDDNEEFDMDYYRELAEECFDFGSHDGRYRGYDYYEYKEAAYRASSALNEILDEVAELMQQGIYAEAAGKAMAVAEIIPQNEDNIDDSDGELSDSFSKAIKLLCDIVNSAGVSFFVKQEIYKWSQKEAGNTIYSSYGYNDIQIIYEQCCMQLGDTDETLADIDRKINEAKTDYQKDKVVLWKIRFMLSRNLDANDIIQAHLDVYEVRKILFNQLKDAQKYDEALLIAEQGVAIAKQRGHSSIVWQKDMFDIYLIQGDTANLLPMAEYLFLHAGYNYKRDEFYKVLQEFTPATDWQDTVERLLTAIEKGQSFDSAAAQIMHGHQMWERLFAYCKRGGISNMEYYENDLKPHYEKDLLAYYLEYAEKQALITDWRAYAEVARILKRMRTFAGGNDLVNQLLIKYRSTYKRRKNMITVLNGI